MHSHTHSLDVSPEVVARGEESPPNIHHAHPSRPSRAAAAADKSPHTRSHPHSHPHSITPSSRDPSPRADGAKAFGSEAERPSGEEYLAWDRLGVCIDRSGLLVDKFTCGQDGLGCGAA